MTFRPLHDRVLVRRVTAEEKSAGGIIIPDTELVAFSWLVLSAAG